MEGRNFGQRRAQAPDAADKGSNKYIQASPASFFAKTLECTIMIPIKAGADKKVIWTHRDNLAESESASLKALVSGLYKEGDGQNGIDWSDWEYETVVQFVTYLSIGDYHVKVPELKGMTPEMPKKPNSKNGKTAPATASVPGLSRAILPLSRIDKLLPDPALPTWRRNTDAGDFHFTLQDAKHEDKQFEFGPTLVSHAKVYVLADYHNVDTLKALSLRRLAQTMQMAELHTWDLISDVLALVEFVYPDDIGRPQQLRDVVSHFVALHYSKLVTNEEVLTTLERGGEFVRDVCAKVGSQILVHEAMLSGAKGRIAMDQIRKAGEGAKNNVRDIFSLNDWLDGLEGI
ncbi:hypothetical protein AA313_de0201451 [Arthrobotrys entomopaga]|nr:hypothetical protein AA313_de0201451 [Arthrobotrys entomopaga]